MPDWVYAVILGIIEGLTEFIPVSSTGHLLLAKELFGLPDAFWDTFAVMIQLGAILAVVALYFAKLWQAVVTLPTDPASRRFAISVILAFIPSVVMGVLFYDLIKQVLFESPLIICVSLVLGGIVLLVIDRFAPAPRHEDPTQLPWLTSLGVGFFQVISMIPGVSRSGATIVGSMLLGVEKRAAAEFSFFLAIPTMAAAFTKDAWESRDLIDLSHAWIIGVGFVVSLVTAIVVIKAMLAIVTARGYAPFGWWRIIVGGIGLVAIGMGSAGLA